MTLAYSAADDTNTSIPVPPFEGIHIGSPREALSALQTLPDSPRQVPHSKRVGRPSADKHDHGDVAAVSVGPPDWWRPDGVQTRRV